MNEIEEILEKIGLKKLESKVYLALLELQESQTGNICKFTNIASSNIYNLLDSLLKKGLVSYKVQNNIKIFMPSPPESLNELFLEKQSQLEQERKEISKLISTLKKREIKQKPYSNYKYYEGFVGIKSMWHEINNIMTNDYIIRIYTGRRESYERLIGFYTEHQKLRAKKKIHERLIYPKEDIKLAMKRKAKFGGELEIKFMDLKNDAEWGVLGDVVFIQHITEKTPRGFLIKDKTFAKTYEQVFDQLWRIAKL